LFSRKSCAISAFPASQEVKKLARNPDRRRPLVLGLANTRGSPAHRAVFEFKPKAHAIGGRGEVGNATRREALWEAAPRQAHSAQTLGGVNLQRAAAPRMTASTKTANMPDTLVMPSVANNMMKADPANRSTIIAATESV
jgi:hypothetical protein